MPGTITASYVHEANTTTSQGNFGKDVMGGLVGKNSGAITVSYTNADIDGDSEDDVVGGLVGQNWGTILASYATGNAKGSLGNGDTVGSLVGKNSSDDAVPVTGHYHSQLWLW